jgi:hypothetical protein
VSFANLSKAAVHSLTLSKKKEKKEGENIYLVLFSSFFNISCPVKILELFADINTFQVEKIGSFSTKLLTIIIIVKIKQKKREGKKENKSRSFILNTCEIFPALPVTSLK